MWSQRDPRWYYKKLGTSGCRMGPKGCAVTCLSIIILRWYWDIHKHNPSKIWRPGDVCDWMSANGRFNPQGYAYLNTVDTLTGGKCINVWQPDGARYTMVRVVWGGLDHWVVKLDGDLCLDPWDKTIKYLAQPKWNVTPDTINGIPQTSNRKWFKLI